MTTIMSWGAWNLVWVVPAAILAGLALSAILPLDRDKGMDWRP